jgi:hypothetical protein
LGAHEAFAAFPLSGGAETNRSTQRAYVVKRTALCLADSEDLQTITVADSGLGTGAVPLYVIQSGRLFALDALDVITAHDGTTCLVSEDGKRYKVVTFNYPDSVLDKDLTAPPDSPEASVGDAFIVGVAATDDWAGQDNKIAVQTERGWQFVTVPIGRLIYVEDETSFYHRNAGGTWTAGVGSVVLGADVVLASNMKGGGGNLHHIVENQTTNAPPGTVTEGAKYIIGSSPTGAWSGHAGKVAIGENGAWVVYTPAEGWIAYDKALNIGLRFTGTAWESSVGAWVAVAAVSRVNGDTTANGSNTVYNFSQAAPTTAQRVLFDDATITHTARSAAALLRLDYAASFSPVNGPNLGFGTTRPLTLAVFRDDEEDAIAHRVLAQGGAINTLMSVDTFFVFAPGDTNEHEYKIGFMSGTSSTGTTFDATDVVLRNFMLQEAA